MHINTDREDLVCEQEQLRCFIVLIRELRRTTWDKANRPQNVKQPTATLVTPPSPRSTSLMHTFTGYFPSHIDLNGWFKPTPGSAPDTATLSCVSNIMTHIFFVPFFLFSKFDFQSRVRVTDVFEDIWEQQAPIFNNLWLYNMHGWTFHL